MIKLNDILNLTKEEIANSKIGLNMTLGHRGKYCLQEWLDTKREDFLYHNTSKIRNFKIGNWVFGFVQYETNKRWLLVSTGEVTSIPEKGENGTCEHKPIDKRFEGFIGRLVIEISNKKGNMGRYAYNMEKFIDEAEVIEILPKIYEGKEFSTFEDIYLSFGELSDIIDGKKRKSIRDALYSVYGVYLLTSDDGNYKYVGSAYGNDGLAQRWKEYLKTQTGSNKKLIQLYNEKPDYFREHFYFSIIQTFSKYSDKNDVLECEYHWMKILNTRQGNGLNN